MHNLRSSVNFVLTSMNSVLVWPALAGPGRLDSGLTAATLQVYFFFRRAGSRGISNSSSRKQEQEQQEQQQLDPPPLHRLEFLFLRF